MFNHSLSDDSELKLPPLPVKKKKILVWLFRAVAITYTIIGLYYFGWRGFNILNHFTFFIALFYVAEFLLFIGSLFRIPSYWSYKDPSPKLPARLLSDISTLSEEENDRPISIALFVATHNEPVSIIKQTLEDCKKVTYPYPEVDINTYLLDDGHIDIHELSLLCESLGVRYIKKEDNTGYKAGNLNHAFHQTEEDFIVILDADTRPFPDMCGHTTGYFRDFELAWVQTPQWYNDVSSPLLPSVYFKKIMGKSGWLLGKLLDLFTLKKLYLNKDIYASNPKFFYDAILRNRNPYNAVFSCGAGSIYRRSSLKAFEVLYPDTPGPFQHHISEDLFNSMLMHNAGMKSLYHHYPECQMLSPQDLNSWIKQQKRYASGAINIFLQYNPIKLKGLSFIQKVMYFSAGYSYFTPLLAYFFFMTPFLYFFLDINIIPGFYNGFIPLFIIYQFFNLSTFVLANWGISTKRPDQKFWSSFAYVTTSWWQNLKGKKLSFNVTPKTRIRNNSFIKTLPHCLLIILFLAAPIYYFSKYEANTLSLFYAFWCGYFIFQLNQFVRVWVWDQVRKD